MYTYIYEHIFCCYIDKPIYIHIYIYKCIYIYGGFSFVAMPEARPLGASPLGPLRALNGPPVGLLMGPA